MRVFTKEELWQLRNEIVLNSLYLKDYSNLFEIPEDVCYNFFEGYVEELCLQAEDEGFKWEDIIDVFNKYDTPENLYYYYSCCENAFDYL